MQIGVSYRFIYTLLYLQCFQALLDWLFTTWISACTPTHHGWAIYGVWRPNNLRFISCHIFFVISRSKDPSFNNSITPSSVNNSPNSSVISIPSFPHAFPSFPLAHINSGIHQRIHPNIHTSIHDHAFSKCTQYTSTCYSSFTLNVAIARPAQYFMW